MYKKIIEVISFAFNQGFLLGKGPEYYYENDHYFKGRLKAVLEIGLKELNVTQQAVQANAMEYCDFSDYNGGVCPKCNNTHIKNRTA